MIEDIAAARRIELEFVYLRWVAVLFGALETAAVLMHPSRYASGVAPLALAMTAGLAAANIAIWSSARRAVDHRDLVAVGAVAFSLDVVVVLAMTWTFITGREDIVWLVAFVLPLEGAARYRRGGAVAVAIVIAGSIYLREFYIVAQYPPYQFSLASVEFRVAMAFVIALTAGSFARSLHLQTERADRRTREAEAATRREAAALARLQELDKLKSDFISITSHELRTPVSAVRGFVDTLRRRRDDLTEDEVREFLDIIYSQSDRLVRLVEDLLDVSRLEAGRLNLEWEEVSVDQVLSSTIMGMGEAGSRILVQGSPTCPPTIVSDSLRLTQMLTNLLGNALKFSPPGAQVEMDAESGDRGEIVFSVRDHGPGIPDSDHTKIFERFEQADSEATRNSQGVGLGLYITRELAAAMGGQVTLTSELGEGSTFRITIPVSPPGAPTELVRPSVAARSD